MSGTKFVGWVSENYLGMARIMRWFYSLLPAVQDDPPYVEPCRPMSTWNVNELKQWLTVRGLCDKGGKNGLKDRVDATKNSGNPVPPPLAPIGGSVTGVLDTIKALAVIIAHVMSPVVNITEIDSARQHIKLFLTKYHLFEAPMVQGSSQNPGWLSSYNFRSRSLRTRTTQGGVQTKAQSTNQGEYQAQTQISAHR